MQDLKSIGVFVKNTNLSQYGLLKLSKLKGMWPFPINQFQSKPLNTYIRAKKQRTVFKKQDCCLYPKSAVRIGELLK